MSHNKIILWTVSPKTYIFPDGPLVMPVYSMFGTSQGTWRGIKGK